MWDISHLQDWESLIDKVEPEEILDETDEPMIFTLKAKHQLFMLAYLCDSDETTNRYLLVACSYYLLHMLKKGLWPLFRVLDRPVIGIVETMCSNGTQVVTTCKRATIADIPIDVLPVPGTTLNIEHDPFYGPIDGCQTSKIRRG